MVGQIGVLPYLNIIKHYSANRLFVNYTFHAEGAFPRDCGIATALTPNNS